MTEILTPESLARGAHAKPHRAMLAVLRDPNRQGATLAELRTCSASLEDVFFTPTGRHLRDD
jgi:hypothetical protein